VEQGSTGLPIGVQYVLMHAACLSKRYRSQPQPATPQAAQTWETAREQLLDA